MGKSEKRNVTVFVVTGVLLAGGVGLGVWQVSSPTAPATTDIATTSTLSTTRAADESSTGENADDAPEIGPTDDVIEEASPSLRDDPFLAPNAVLSSAPEHSAPTTTYRPDNVVPLSPRYDDEPAGGSDAGTFRSEPSAEPAPVEPIPTDVPLEPETAPSLPEQPTVPDSEATPEAETTPETESPTSEATPQPSAPEQPEDEATPSLPPQEEPEPTATVPEEEPSAPAQQPAMTPDDAAQPEEPAPAPVDEQGSGARPTPWERALSWLRG